MEDRQGNSKKDILHHDSIGAIISELIVTSYPIKMQSYRLAKVSYLSKEELFQQKAKEKCSDFEVYGDNYLFWCFIMLQKPMFKKKWHQQFEERKTFNRFLFGQVTICSGQLLCDVKELDFFYWARIAYQKGWFNSEDIRDMHISYFLDEKGKIASKLLLERISLNDPGIR